MEYCLVVSSYFQGSLSCLCADSSCVPVSLHISLWDCLSPGLSIPVFSYESDLSDGPIDNSVLFLEGRLVSFIFFLSLHILEYM